MHTINRSQRRLISDGSDTWDAQRPDHPAFSRATWGFIGAAVVTTVGGAVASSDASRKANHTAQDALKSQQQIAAELKYEPIDLEKLKADAASQAAANAAGSLQLERSLQPNVASTREGLSKSVSDQLALGGKLSPDVLNQATQAARTAGSASGIGGNSAPLTAALIGQSAQGLLQQRQSNAASLLAANPLPVAGLDPGSLASAEVAQNAAQNQFNLEKAGVASNLVNSNAQIQGANAGANASQWSSILGLVGGLLGKANFGGGSTITPTTTGGSSVNPGTFNGTIPQLSASGLWG